MLLHLLMRLQKTSVEGIHCDLVGPLAGSWDNLSNHKKYIMAFLPRSIQVDQCVKSH